MCLGIPPMSCPFVIVTVLLLGIVNLNAGTTTTHHNACESRLDPVLPSGNDACANGVCEPTLEADDYVCECFPGHGDNLTNNYADCDVFDPCLAIPHCEHGSCVVNSGNSTEAHCECEYGYKGVACQEELWFAFLLQIIDSVGESTFYSIGAVAALGIVLSVVCLLKRCIENKLNPEPNQVMRDENNPFKRSQKHNRKRKKGKTKSRSGHQWGSVDEEKPLVKRSPPKLPEKGRSAVRRVSENRVSSNLTRASVRRVSENRITSRTHGAVHPVSSPVRASSKIPKAPPAPPTMRTSINNLHANHMDNVRHSQEILNRDDHFLGGQDNFLHEEQEHHGYHQEQTNNYNMGTTQMSEFDRNPQANYDHAGMNQAIGFEQSHAPVGNSRTIMNPDLYARDTHGYSDQYHNYAEGYHETYDTGHDFYNDTEHHDYGDTAYQDYHNTEYQNYPYDQQGGQYYDQ